MKRFIAFWICVAAVVFSAVADEEEPEYICSTQDPIPGLAQQDTVEGRIVFVYFPSAPAGYDSLLPAWGPWLAQELREWISTMSRGKQTFNIEIVKRFGADSTKAWRAPNPASTYFGNFSPPNYATLNDTVMQNIHDVYFAHTGGDSLWKSVSFVSMIHYQNAFWRSGIGGEGSLGTDIGYPVMVPGFTEGETQRGATQRLYISEGLDTLTTAINHRVANGAGHEFAHAVVTYQHTPGSAGLRGITGCGTPTTTYVNIGLYDILRGVAGGGGPNPGLLPLHSWWLIPHNRSGDPDVDWLPDSLITSDMRGLRVKDIRADGKAYRVNAPDTTQYYLLENRQGLASSRWDAKLHGTGLLVWHILPDIAWDMESAAGKFTNGNPDSANAVSGFDSLELDWCYGGGPYDYFDGGQSASRGNFSRTTNPNTNRYQYSYNYKSPQNVATSVAFENIRKDTYSLDMLVDVFVDPKHYITFPAAAVGDTLPKGVSWGTLWDVREYAGIRDSVDISVLNAGGVPVTTWLNRPNSGSFTLGPFGNAGQYRIRLLSRDPLTSAADTSVALTVWEITESSISNIVSQNCNGNTIKFDVTWNTTVATTGPDSLLIYAPGASCTGSPTYKAKWDAQSATSHHVQWQGPCQTGLWHYIVKTTKLGSGTTKSSCKEQNVTECITCPPPCHPPCELE